VTGIGPNVCQRKELTTAALGRCIPQWGLLRGAEKGYQWVVCSMNEYKRSDAKIDGPHRQTTV